MLNEARTVDDIFFMADYLHERYTAEVLPPVVVLLIELYPYLCKQKSKKTIENSERLSRRLQHGFEHNISFSPALRVELLC